MSIHVPTGKCNSHLLSKQFHCATHGDLQRDLQAEKGQRISNCRESNPNLSTSGATAVLRVTEKKHRREGGKTVRSREPGHQITSADATGKLPSGNLNNTIA